MFRCALIRAVWLIVCAFAAVLFIPSLAEAVDYEREIKPLLIAKCSRCHGALKQESGFRVDTAAFLAKGGDRGPGFVAGKSGEGHLLDALLGKNDIERMPLEGKPLADDEIVLIKRWIDEGAAAPADEKPIEPLDHWSFRQVVRPELPATSRDAWARGPIDRFVAAKLDERKLSPQVDAARTTLLRRVYLDLVGLPPTADELAAFLADASPDAYDRAVDRLLASPQHGERWARHWMDVWRYSDWAGWTDGGQIRDSQPHIWRWRDWIVEALNADRPYDQMVVEMLAADEVAPTDASALRATGFVARNYKMLSRETWMQDVVEHTTKAFLALTINCAQCHDHMYDPILQDDYFRMRAVFEPHQVRIDRVPGQLDTKLNGLPRVYDANLDAVTKFYLRGDERTPDPNRNMPPGVPTVFGEAEFHISAIKLPPEATYPDLRDTVREDMLRGPRAELAAATTAAAAANADAIEAPRVVAVKRTAVDAIEARFAADRAKLTLGKSPEDAAEIKKLARAARFAEQLAAFLSADHDQRTQEKALASLAGSTAADAKKQSEEAEKKLAETNERLITSLVAVFDRGENYTPIGTSYPAHSTGRRTALARWIARPANPLTARVAVNHLWLRHFGQAIVPTVFDFGKNGKPPVNGPLLDWLASEMTQESGTGDAWSMKRLHRSIVTSSVYRQAATHDAASAAIDPDNVALWRWPARRIEAETVRDMVLYVAGSLDLAHGGADIDHKQGLSVPRRSIYFRHAPEKQMDFLQLFDAAAPTQCYRRTESVMPQQALALANSRLTLAASRRLAREISQQVDRESSAAASPQSPAPSPQPPFISAAFRQVLAREATAEELKACEEFLTSQAELFTTNRERLTVVAADSADVEKPSGEPMLRARENLVHALFNHHDFVTQR